MGIVITTKMAQFAGKFSQDTNTYNKTVCAYVDNLRNWKTNEFSPSRFYSVDKITIQII